MLVLLALGRPARHPQRRSSASGPGRCSARPPPARASRWLVAVVALPFGIWAHERSVDVGLSTQALGRLARRAGKATAIGAVLAAAGRDVRCSALMRRFGLAGGSPGRVAVVLGRRRLHLAGAGRARAALQQVRRAPAGPGAQPTSSSSPEGRGGRRPGLRGRRERRTTAINAYVNGIGSIEAGRPLRHAVIDLNRASAGPWSPTSSATFTHDDIQRGLLFARDRHPAVAGLRLALAGGWRAAADVEPGQPAAICPPSPGDRRRRRS